MQNSLIIEKPQLTCLALTSSPDSASSPNSSDDSNQNQGDNSRSHLYSDTAELKRQLAWNKSHEGGKKASIEEWNEEVQRRRAHEGILYPNHHDNPNVSLIPHTSLALDPDSGTDSGSSTLVSAIESNDTAGATTTDSVQLAIIDDVSHHESTDEASLAWNSDSLGNVAPVHTCTPPFGQLEAAQWQT